MVTPSSVRVGHWTDRDAKTGCTVILFDRSVLAAVDVRGGAPGTRETDALGSANLVRRIDALVFTGGSVLGLAAADGVVGFLRGLGRGFPTPAGPVPIVPAAVIYDLGRGTPVAPDAEAGAAASASAVDIASMERGLVGAGTGATAGDAFSRPRRGGIGYGRVEAFGIGATAIAVVNAYGEPVIGPGGLQSDRRRALLDATPADDAYGQSTTIAVVILDGPCDHQTLQRCTIAAHDGLARAIRPAHTVFDGDTVFAVSLGEVTAGEATTPQGIFQWSLASELAIEQAIADAVTA
jgi:L-aminopeptidase/D-esterase-like protein